MNSTCSSSIMIPIPKNNIYSLQLCRFFLREPNRRCRQFTSDKDNRELEMSEGVNNNIFDPINSSPPNEFMLKLKLRSTIYGDNIQNYLEYSNNKKKDNNIYLSSDNSDSFNISSSLEKK